MKKSSSNSRYLGITHTIFWRIPIAYTERGKEKIISYFPKKKQEAALKETTNHISKLVSCLGSEITPKNIKREENAQRIKVLRDCIQSLENQLQLFLQQAWHPNTIELKNKFYRLIHPEYPQITLQTLGDLILYLKLACNEFIRNPGRPGRKNPDYYEAVENLASIWKRYLNKEPTLHNKTTDINIKTGKKIKQRPCGPFLEYLNISIKSAIRYANKNRKNKISLESVSLANIARDVIRSRKESMAKIPSK